MLRHTETSIMICVGTKSVRAERSKVKHTSCLAFTAPPDDAMDWRDVVFVLKLRVAMLKTKTSVFEQYRIRSQASIKKWPTKFEAVSVAFVSTYDVVTVQTVANGLDCQLSKAVEFRERGGSTQLLIGGGPTPSPRPVTV